jgi:hypothetical protein
LSTRSEQVPSAITLPSGSVWKSAAEPIAWLVNSPTISSRMSFSVTSPRISPYSSTTRPTWRWFSWKLVSWSEQVRALRDEVGLAQ